MIDFHKIQEIKSLPYFQESIYANLDIEGTLDFFIRRYINPLSKHFDISTTTALDCGTGFGWFSIAYLMEGGKSVIAVDLDQDRLNEAKNIADIFSVSNRIEFIAAAIQDIPLVENSVDIFISIETLEHVGKENIKSALLQISDIASRGVLITTPNKFFPVIAHDTRLPFIHWLSPRKRGKYAKLFGRESWDHGNDFVSPSNLRILFEKFEPSSSCLTFADYKSYISHFPFYLPYGSDQQKRFHNRPSLLKAIYYWIVSKILGNYSYWLMPSLSHIFVKNQNT